MNHVSLAVKHRNGPVDRSNWPDACGVSRQVSGGRARPLGKS